MRIYESSNDQNHLRTHLYTAIYQHIASSTTICRTE